MERVDAALAESGIASLPDSSWVALRAWGYDGVATPYPAWGFAPNPSKERCSLHPFSASRRLEYAFFQLSLRDSIVEGAGNLVPCRELEGGALNVFPFFTQKKL